MIRFLNAYFPTRTVVLGVSEVLLVSFSFVAAAVVRLGASDTGVMLSYENGLSKILLVSGAFIVCMYYFDLYDSSVLSNRRELPIRLVQVLGTVCFLLAFVYYLYPPLELGRGIASIGLIFVAFVLLLWRRLFLFINSAPQLADRTLILGDGALAEPILRECESRPELGLRIVGRLLADNREGIAALHMASDLAGENTEKTPITDIAALIARMRVKRILVVMGEKRGRLPVGSLLNLKCQGIRIQEGTELYEAITGKVPIDYVRSGWLLFSSGFQVSTPLLLYKRMASACSSILGLVMSLPLIPLIVAAIRLSSPGPILYRQKRVGRGGLLFDCYKFRTMRADAEADTGPTWAADDDPRITAVGRFLRQSRMDEIPQLWNVLKGDMSLVGPRPERPEFVSKLREEIPFYDLRHTVRPGITGWAQINYRYGASVEDAKEKLRYDLFYIKNMSPGLDLLIYFRTLKIILLGRGAR